MVNKKNISCITLEVDYIVPDNKISILRLKADVWPNGEGEFPSVSMGFPDLGASEVETTGAFMGFKSLKQLESFIEDFKSKIKLLTNKTI